MVRIGGRESPHSAPFRLVSRAGKRMSQLTVVRLRQRKGPKRDRKWPKMGFLASAARGSDKWPGSPAFCGFSTADQEREKECPDWRDWRREWDSNPRYARAYNGFETPRSRPSAWVSICVASWSSSPLQTATPNSLSSSLFQTGSRIREADRRDPPGAMHDEIRFEGFGPTVDGSCVRCARVGGC